MKARNYAQILKQSGYKCVDHNDYQGTDVYEKQHIYTKMVCYVTKDSHGKGQEMVFTSYNTLRTPKNMEEFKFAEFDRSYLVMEAQRIHNAFEELKKLRSPKHLYFN